MKEPVFNYVVKDEGHEKLGRTTNRHSRDVGTLALLFLSSATAVVGTETSSIGNIRSREFWNSLSQLHI
jgi:hypothetical protein